MSLSAAPLDSIACETGFVGGMMLRDPDSRAVRLVRLFGAPIKVDKITPMGHPLVHEPWVIAFHNLKAAAEAGLDPTGNVLQSPSHTVCC